MGNVSHFWKARQPGEEWRVGKCGFGQNWHCCMEPYRHGGWHSVQYRVLGPHWGVEMPTLKKPGQRWFFKGLSPQFFFWKTMQNLSWWGESSGMILEIAFEMLKGSFRRFTGHSSGIRWLSVLLEHPICCPADGGAENVHVLRRVFYSSRLGSKNRPQRLREKILHKDWRADVWLVLYPLISHEFPLYPSFSWMVQRAKLRQLFAMGWSDSLWPAWRLSGSALTPLVHYIEFDQSYLPIK